jgi:hypothetical protein
LRLNQDDVITVTALYDVDEASNLEAPFPGGKHGGVMGLFFYMMDCDEGTTSAEYACRQGACIATSPDHSDYKTLAECKTGCK